MHTRAKSGARVNMDHRAALILRSDLLPGRNDQQIVHVKLLEILLPVVDPVLILCLRRRNAGLSDIHELAQLLQRLLHPGKDRIHVRILLQIKVQVSNAVIVRRIRQNVHKHLLLVFL